MSRDANAETIARRVVEPLHGGVDAEGTGSISSSASEVAARFGEALGVDPDG